VFFSYAQAAIIFSSPILHKKWQMLLKIEVSKNSLLLAHLAFGNVSFCHDLASVIRRLSSVVR
jgi:hypothetical protein